MPAFKTKSELQYWDWNKIVTKKPTKRATEQVFSWAGLGVARETNELQDIYYRDLSELAATTFTVGKFTLATMFSHEFLQDNLHLPELLKEAGEEMGDGHRYIRDQAVAQVFNRAFNSSFTMYDGVELCGTHTLKSGDTLDNDLAPASISFDNVWLMLDYFSTTMLSQDGLNLRDTPKYLLYHPVKEKLVRAVLQSELEPGTADNDKNTVKSFNLVPIPCRFLSTDTNWFIMGEKFPNDFCFFTREKPQTAMQDDFDRMGTKCRSYQRFALGVKEFIRIVGNPGA
jgi:hypothetical protein